MDVRLQRLVGFAPEEISCLVNEDVVSQHADEAAFLWTTRSRAIAEPHYSLEQLAALDERVEAHLAGLVIAGDTGWSRCQDQLPLGEPGGVFAASVLAFGSGHRARMSETLRAGCGSPVTWPGLVSALGWLEYDQVSPWILRLLEASSPLHRAVGIAASAIHRVDPGHVLATSLDDSDSRLRARALRATGELKRHDLLNRIRPHLDDKEASCRFWAAWSLSLHKQAIGLESLIRQINATNTGQRAMQLALRAMSLEEGRRWISASSENPDQIRLTVIAAGIVGDPGAIPWLIRRMEDATTARLAGEAFAFITGIDIGYHDLELKQAPEEIEDGQVDAGLALDYESNLPTPSPELVTEWWSRNHSTFAANTRYLCGKPVTVESAREILSTGKQRQRAAAALEIALLDPEAILFEVRAKAAHQTERLRAAV